MSGAGRPRTPERVFLPYLRELLAGAPVLHADETTGRAAGSLSYVHVACTQYLTLMHVGGRSGADIDAGGVLPEFTRQSWWVTTDRR